MTDSIDRALATLNVVISELQFAKNTLGVLQGRVKSQDAALVENAKNYDTEVADLRAKVDILTKNQKALDLLVRGSGTKLVYDPVSGLLQGIIGKGFEENKIFFHGDNPVVYRAASNWGATTVRADVPPMHTWGRVDPRMFRWATSGPIKDPVQNIIDTCNEAAKTGQRLRMQYRNQDGEITWRTIVPQSVRADGKAGRTLIYAYDFLRDAKRSFRADRVLAIYKDRAPLEGSNG